MTRPAAGMLNGFDDSRLDAQPPETQALLRRRAQALGPSYRLFYDDPLHVVRAEGVWLEGADGRRYLDAYNNVPSVGHCHPRVVEAIREQAGILNTHTRYLGEALLDYSERLLATFPQALDRVMYTCTGSEAVDLALRIARHVTGGTGIIVTANAYHGVTAASAEISPSMGVNSPLGPHVMTIRGPDPRAAEGGDVAAMMARDVEEAIAFMKRRGIRPAAFVADGIFSTDGIFADPEGFLAPAVEAARAGGALYVADEVQPGFGRLGAGMWGFARHGLVPDIVVMGKPMGNGMPIAAAVMQARHQEAFGRDIRYFNTFGANHVSIAAAAAVLSVIEDEGLIANSAAMGRLMTDGMRALQAKDPRIADVRGAGLFIGVEFRTPDDRPDGPLAHRVVNGLRARGVLISTAGAAGNVLKIRPPMCFAPADAALFLDTLGETLAAIAPEG